MADKALSSVKNLISKLGLKAPWKLTGVASTPEFLGAAPVATEYRRHAPASQPLKPIVPHAKTENVYDIRYWVRDTKRQGQLVGGTNKTHVVKYEYNTSSADEALSALDLPPQLGKPFKWTKKQDLLDVDNNGYT